MNKISPSAKKQFLISRGIKNLEQLVELLKTYYYTHRDHKLDLLKDYDTEQLSVFLWMHDKYVKGKFAKLKELFVSSFVAESEKQYREKLDETLEKIVWKKSPEELESQINKNLQYTKDEIEKAKSQAIDKDLYNASTSWQSTRHKVNPETTSYIKSEYIPKKRSYTLGNVNYHHIEFVEKEKLQVTQTTSEGYRRTYEVEQPKYIQTLMPNTDLDSLSFRQSVTMNFDPTYNLPKPATLTINGKEHSILNSIPLKDISKIRVEPCLSGDLEKAIRQSNQSTPYKSTNPFPNNTEPFILPKITVIEEKSKDTQYAGKKETEGKLPLELDFDFVKQMAERMNSNKSNGKYSLFNWKSEMDIRLLSEAVMRHCIEVIEGRYEDDGRSYGHLEALATGAMMINWQLKEKQRKANEFFSLDLVDKK